jgi:hypothetical protein
VPIALERDNIRRWLRARGTGTLTIDELLTFLRTARSSHELRMWPMIFDGTAASTNMTDEDVDRAVAFVAETVTRTGPRAHVALAIDDDRLYRWMLSYETKCADAGVRIIRVFRQMPDAERWLDIVSAARNLH